ncbi:MAG: LysM peptidoglycan-binding domain-containing protein [Bacillota bacterium]|uniref:LysM peptidoglycan-binding domain-containing protein n=2 Tax=Virgibacillus salarius TaxID=447199 RepID=A0A941DSC8_9BACI|nr:MULTISPECIES: peptidoglycan endopeptidase [Bacillaceae]NAZ08428.1 LysM peptidoglycan-binding domain-containing protein [Agaribacter marinus]MBR7795715.1 LysM peptidoglycan-binding domain-containing protein [Virgibacillus salarius]MCC2248579.1 LysM peptidoglycan-binding domain-containing protein [Virgibacillus sp. AGTR]MDY7043219.1 LysM peptidoglycan-binding domain-containing protein [Virgibacillus sp. M23]QRZ18338.1 LysM peptidoglycan-binding domain-containing protein [Virgibacillus sp. AGT
MSNKKIIMSVTASAAIASAIFAAEEVEAASHKVKSGESLWTIAQKYNTNVAKLKSINKLSGDTIYPNQIIETENNNTSGSSSSSSKPTNNNSNSSKTYTVKSGDTLSGIAIKYNISLSNLMKWNNLNSTLIYPGNVLAVSKNSSNGSSSTGSNSGSSSSNNSSNQTGSTKVYIVKSGDTLSRIALQYKVSVANLKKWNNLNSDLIFIGQKLSIGSSSNTNSNGNTNEKPSNNVQYNVEKVIQTAKSMQGVKYVWGGSTPSGFDCSGFIHYVYKKGGMSINRLSSDGYFNRSHYVTKPQVGDLVFFAGTYRPGISHLGIYLGNNTFIHAGSSGVQISSLNNSYWKKHFDSFKRFY